MSIMEKGTAAALSHPVQRPEEQVARDTLIQLWGQGTAGPPSQAASLNECLEVAAGLWRGIWGGGAFWGVVWGGKADGSLQEDGGGSRATLGVTVIA